MKRKFNQHTLLKEFIIKRLTTYTKVSDEKERGFLNILARNLQQENHPTPNLTEELKKAAAPSKRTHLLRNEIIKCLENCPLTIQSYKKNIREQALAAARKKDKAKTVYLVYQLGVCRYHETSRMPYKTVNHFKIPERRDYLAYGIDELVRENLQIPQVLRDLKYTVLLPAILQQELRELDKLNRKVHKQTKEKNAKEDCRNSHHFECSKASYKLREAVEKTREFCSKLEETEKSHEQAFIAIRDSVEESRKMGEKINSGLTKTINQNIQSKNPLDEPKESLASNFIAITRKTNETKKGSEDIAKYLRKNRKRCNKLSNIVSGKIVAEELSPLNKEIESLHDYLEKNREKFWRIRKGILHNKQLEDEGYESIHRFSEDEFILYYKQMALRELHLELGVTCRDYSAKLLACLPAEKAQFLYECQKRAGDAIQKAKTRYNGVIKSYRFNALERFFGAGFFAFDYIFSSERGRKALSWLKSWTHNPKSVNKVQKIAEKTTKLSVSAGMFAPHPHHQQEVEFKKTPDSKQKKGEEEDEEDYYAFEVKDEGIFSSGYRNFDKMDL